MSRPRSRSPRFRRFPWEEPDLNSHHNGSKLDGHQLDRNNPEEFREYFDEEPHPGGQRRPPPRPEDRPFGRPHHPTQEFHHRRSSPHRDDGCYKQRRFTPPCDAWRGADRRREDFRPRPQTFENKRQSSQSPVRISREGPPPTARPHSDHQQREPPGDWRREEWGRGRFREFSSDRRSDQDQGRRSSQGSPHQNRNFPPFKWHKRNMDGEQQAGFMDEEDFGGQGYSVEASRGGFGQSSWRGAPRGQARHSGTVFNRGRVGSWEPPRRREQFDDDRDADPGFGGRRSPRPRDDPRGRRFHEPRRSPPDSQDRPSPGGFAHQGGAFVNRGRSTFRPMRNRHSGYRGARTGPTSTPPPPHFQQSSQDLPEEEQRGHRPLPKDPKEEEEEEEDGWPEEDRRQPWDKGRNLDPKMPRQRRFNQLESGNMATAATEETLTIKVDMSRPAQHNSPLCYSSDRQLSLDLVNVGRQRLDFLPMLEHSGSYRETAMHTGTFAQEIITLVHQVKDQYFRGDQLTLNQRFSAPQKSSYSVEGGGLTLDQRFKPNRGSALNTGALLDGDETLFSSLGPPQSLSQPPVRGPGDLRHDLERRRQEKLEGVKVTIPGQSAPQRPLAAVREPQEEEEQQQEEEDEEFSCRMKHDFEGASDWMEEQSMKTEGRMGLRRGGGPGRPNPFFHRRNDRLTNRRTNFQSGSTGPDW